MMRMALASDWRVILKRAWSVRLIILAGALSGVEVALPLFSDSVPRGLFTFLSAVASIFALWARIVAQKGLENE